MTTKMIDVREAQTRLSDLLSGMTAGTEILLTSDDIPVARILPVLTPTKVRVAGLHRGAFWTSDDFDEPLPDSFWLGEE